MPSRAFEYRVEVAWKGNLGSGTSGYRDYSRDHEVAVADRPAIAASADPAFRGDPDRYSPEELLIASLSGCHMLWYLHLCADAGIVVLEYADRAIGEMVVRERGDGRFRRVVLRPRIVLQAGADRDLAMRLHGEAHQYCFIASSVAFPVHFEPAISVQLEPDDLQPVA